MHPRGDIQVTYIHTHLMHADFDTACKVGGEPVAPCDWFMAFVEPAVHV